MKEAYVGIEPPNKNLIKVDYKDLALYSDSRNYICYTTKIPRFYPKNIVLVMPKATELMEKKLKGLGFNIHKDTFNIKRLFLDQNRKAVFEDIERLEHRHIMLLAKNESNSEVLSQVAELFYSVDNKILKAIIVYSIKAKDIKIKY